jgi:hypothetical protein
LADVQARQVPAHAESQHTPSAQAPDRHWAAELQAAPSPKSGWQVRSPVRHQLVAWHSASESHVVPHALELTHTYGAHGVVLGWHVPFPSHWASVVTPAVHEGATHTTPDAYRRHAPDPLHEPSVPQVCAAVVAHSPSGSAPGAIGPQAPFVPLPFFADVQATQVVLQAALQHTPSTQ